MTGNYYLGNGFPVMLTNALRKKCLRCLSLSTSLYKRNSCNVQRSKYLRFNTVTITGLYVEGGVIFTMAHDSREWHFTQKQ